MCAKALKIKRALISVFDKSGILDLANCLTKIDCSIIATDSTAEFLTSKSFDVKKVSEITGKPALFSNRVKTLDFKLLAAIMLDSSNQKHLQEAREYNIQKIDCVVCNFYDFEKILKLCINQKNKTLTPDAYSKIIENIDIGGPNMVRAAAKNFNSVLVITEQKDYPTVIKELLKNKGLISYETRQYLMKKAFFKIMQYDQMIYDALNLENLRYGENPHQAGYFTPNQTLGLTNLTNNALSYNNYLDIDSTLCLIRESQNNFKNKKLATVVKHGNPCGMALSSNNQKSIELALKSDQTSAFGGVIGFSHKIEKNAIKPIKNIFIEVIVAPDYESEAVELLKKHKPRLRIIKISNKNFTQPKWLKISNSLGFLTQSLDNTIFESYKNVTKTKFDVSLMTAAKMAMLAAKYLKSNAVAIVTSRGGSEDFCQLVATGAGQTSRVEAIRRLALPKMLDNFAQINPKKCVMASDAFFPFADSIESIAKAGIKNIVQPGGSIKDDEVIKACDKHKIAMITTGVRHFRH